MLSICKRGSPPSTFCERWNLTDPHTLLRSPILGAPTSREKAEPKAAYAEIVEEEEKGISIGFAFPKGVEMQFPPSQPARGGRVEHTNMDELQRGTQLFLIAPSQPGQVPHEIDLFQPFDFNKALSTSTVWIFLVEWEGRELPVRVHASPRVLMMSGKMKSRRTLKRRRQVRSDMVLKEIRLASPLGMITLQTPTSNRTR